MNKYKAALWNKGFILNATRDVEMIIRVAKYLKIAGVLATIYGIGKDVVDIIHRIWAGQPWFKKFLEDVAEIAAGIIITIPQVILSIKLSKKFDKQFPKFINEKDAFSAC